MTYNPWIGNLVVCDRLGNYGTLKLLLDEANLPSPATTIAVQVEIAGSGLQAEDFEVEVFTNLNRREFVKVFEPLSDSGKSASSYWLSYPMKAAGPSGDNLVYTVDLPVTKCGAYRLTARYRRIGQTSWWWHNDFAPGAGQARHRDCAVVVSPLKATKVTLYEANALTVEALHGGHYQNRSTLDDFLPEADFDDFNPFDLDYVRNTLGFNGLWLMPIFPNTRWRWDPRAWAWAPNDDPGSPYAARDYYSVNPWLADNGTSERALELLQKVVTQAHAKGLDVMLDVALNHAGRDIRLGQGAVDLKLCGQESAADWIREVRPGWCTRGTEFGDGHTVPHYREAAANDYGCAIWAPSDRLNEHQWFDANVDWFFGDYSNLGPKSGPASQYGVCDPRGGAEDERDLFYTDLQSAQATADLWRYIARFIPFWLAKTENKLAGIRADFAQGLPNHLWEFVINTARNVRWDFVFLAEVLDPPVIQYRLNRVFDILTTVWHSKFRDDNVTMPELFGLLEGEASLFGGNALVMHNGTSHDEEGNPNKWSMVARYAVASAAYGVPMVFMGQPLGLGGKLGFQSQWTDMYNAWTSQDSGRDQVAAMYKRINEARLKSPALSGSARYFLNLQSGGFHNRLFSVARWIPGESTDAIVLAFVNLNVTSCEWGVFALPRSIRLKGRYQVRNLVAEDENTQLWPAPRSADDIYANGVFVRLGYPNEVQYLELVKVN